MINNDRIVPIQKIDFLSMVGIMFAIAQEDYDVMTSSEGRVGYFTAIVGTNDSTKKLANEPVKAINFIEDTPKVMVFFVPAYDFVGFFMDGKPLEPVEGSDEIKADGITLYVALFETNRMRVSAVTPMANAQSSGGTDDGGTDDPIMH